VALMAELTLGPNLFHWPAETLRDFYFRIADEAPVGTVYLGEVVCSKRTPFFEDHLDAVADRLARAGKTVVWCSLSEVVIRRERKLLEAFARQEGRALEVNNTAALLHLQGRPHRIGALMNVYNEATLAYLAERGATHFALLAELPKPVIAVLGPGGGRGRRGDRGAGVRPRLAGAVGAVLSRPRAWAGQGQLPVRLRRGSGRHAADHHGRAALSGGQRHPDAVLYLCRSDGGDGRDGRDPCAARSAEMSIPR
jgi:hypothetical protein